LNQASKPANGQDYKTRPYPVHLGHEPSGEIVAVGKNVTHLKPGQHVVALGSHSFAEYGVYDARYVHPIMESTPYNYALGEPLACAYNATQRTAVQPGDHVVLIGAGFMGLLQLQMMRLADPAVLVAIDIRDDALNVARQVGADIVINSATQDVIDELRKAVGPKGADVVVEAVGKQPGLDLATRIIGFNGRLTVLGYHQGEPRSIDMALWNWKGIDVINGHERYQHVYFKGMVGGITLLEAGKVDMKPLVTHRYPLAQLDEAFHQAAHKPPGFIKAVVEPVAS
jgi:threonine dehydrogenase-like Zn-dependent dehydrogenase